LINNIEEDHLDFYKDLEAIQHSFREFARKLKPKGCLILPEALYSGFQSLPFMVYRVGKSSFCEYQYYQMSTTAMGGAFYFRRRGNPFYRIETPLLGRHNLLNAAMALATAHQAGVSLEESAEALKTAQTPARRFQILQEEPFVIVDDFAHHPTKIARTFQTCRQRFPGQKIRCIFQAHQHHRTRVFLKSFGKILAQAEECYIPPIFSARDTLEEQTQTTASHLVKAIQQQGGSAQEWQSLEALHSYLFETAKAGDVLLILGAGDISLFAKQLALPLNGVQ
jgi:UDP-N-acetylmuramate--alanine ligase